MFKKATVKKVRYRRDAFSHQPFSIVRLNLQYELRLQYEYNFSIISSLFDNNRRHASMQNRKCANNMHHIWRGTSEFRAKT